MRKPTVYSFFVREMVVHVYKRYVLGETHLFTFFFCPSLLAGSFCQRSSSFFLSFTFFYEFTSSFPFCISVVVGTVSIIILCHDGCG